MVYYYEEIYHKNSTDNEEEVIRLHSSKEEPKHIVSIVLFGWANEGELRFYREREKIGSLPTGVSGAQLPHEIQIDLDLPEGQDFKITLKNRVSGTNAEIYGYVKYEIK